MIDVAMAANQLQMDSLLREVKKFLTEKLSIYNCDSIHNLTKQLRWNVLEKASRRMLLQEFDKISLSQLNSLSLGDFKTLISSPELVSRSEDRVIETVLEWVDSYKGLEKEEKVRHLADVLKCCRYLLSTSHFLWQTFDKNLHIQTDPVCREIVRDVLRYKTQLHLHQQWCPAAAVHRRSSKRMNMIFFVDPKHFYYLPLAADPCRSPLTISCYQIDYEKQSDLAGPNSIIGAEFHNGVLYFEKKTWNSVKLHTFVCESYSNKARRVGCVHVGYDMESTALCPVQEKLIALRLYPKTCSIESMELPLSQSTHWESVCRYHTQGLPLACWTNVESNLLMFWRQGDAIVMEWVDLESLTYTLTPNNLNADGGLATFRTDDQVFVIQGDGVLWRLDNLSKAPYVKLIQEKQLWTGKQEIYGAIVANDRLYLARKKPTPYIEVDWCEPVAVDGVFSSGVTVDFTVPLVACFHAVRNNTNQQQ